MATKIVTKNSSTASAVPTTGDLVQGELAVNVADKRLFTEDNAGAIVELGTNPSTIDINAGSIDGTTIGASSASTGAFTTLTATGIDVTGTATMDGLEIATTASDTGVELTLNGNKSSNGGVGSIIFENAGDSVGMIRSNRASANDAADMLFYTQATGGANTERMRIDSSGRVGIGNSAPLGKLTISNAAGTNAPSTVTAANTYLQLGSDDYGPSNNGKFMIGFGFTDATNTNSPAYIGYEEASTSGDTYGDLTFYTRSVTTDTAPTERMRIDSSGNVGIGKTPNTNFSGYVLQLNGGSQTFMSFGNSATGTTLTDGLVIGNDNSGADIYQREAQPLRFHTNNTERMRIDSSGNLLVGTTSTDPAASGSETGVALKGGGFVSISRYDSAATVNINKIGYDGSLVDFRKDGTTVGSIGAKGGTAYLIGSSKGLRVSGSGLIPITTAGANSDATYDIGDQAVRFKDLYLSGGVYLGGTGSANKLDDYEEGTFTPVLTGSGSNPTVTYSNQHGLYTKVGNMVTVWVYVTGSFTGGSGAVTIEGLPFNPDISMSSDIWFEPLNIGSGWQLTTYIPNNDNKIKLYKMNMTGSSNDTAVQWSEVNGLEVRCSFSYKVA